MKRIYMAAFLFTMACCAARAADTNFAGTWALDKDKSEGLRQGAPTDVTWTVTQDAKTLTVERPGFGGGRRGGANAGGGAAAAPRTQKSTFNLDGTETKTEATGGRGGSSVTTAKWGEGNKALETTAKSTFKNQAGDETTRTTKEKWELTDEKTLKVTRTTEGGQGGGESKMVFTKK